MNDILKRINEARLSNKNKWYFLTFNYDGLTIQVKGYNTWLQIFRINGRDYSNCMDQSPTQFKSHILNSIERASDHANA